MIENPKTCWEYEIQTDKLREPDESFRLLQYTIHHPEKTLAECCIDKNVDYGKARNWSSKYFYKERRNAYNKEMSTALQTGIIQHKQYQITEAKKRQPVEENALSDELFFLNNDKQKRAKLKKEGQAIPEYLTEQISEKEKKYWINRNNKLTGDKRIHDLPFTPTPIEDVEDVLLEEKPEIQSFLNAMKENRDAHNKE